MAQEVLHRLIGLSLVAAILALAPAAHANPPDQSWIDGLYDNADFDNIVVVITSNLGAIQHSIGWSSAPVAPIVGRAVPTHTESRPLRPPPSGLGRVLRSLNNPQYTESAEPLGARARLGLMTSALQRMKMATRYPPPQDCTPRFPGEAKTRGTAPLRVQ